MKITFQLFVAAITVIASQTFAKPSAIPVEHRKPCQDTTNNKTTGLAKKSIYVLTFDDATKNKIDQNRSAMFIKKDTIKGAVLRVTTEKPPAKKGN